METRNVDAVLRGLRELVHAASHLAHESARFSGVGATEERARAVSDARVASMRAARAAFALDDALNAPLTASTAKVAEDAILAAEAAFAASRALLGEDMAPAIAAILARDAADA